MSTPDPPARVPPTRDAPGDTAGRAPNERLLALRPPPSEPPARTAEPHQPGEPAQPGPAPPAALAAERPVPAASGIGRLVRRWIPEPAGTARWDPGRPGARALAIVAVLAAVLAAAAAWLGRPNPEPVAPLPALAAAPVPAEAAPPDGPPGALVVSVVGKVADPGLVRLPAGSRVADALEAAGGKLPGSAFFGLNLARKLSDGEQLLVGITPPPGLAASSGRAQGQGPTRINLNTAAREQLETLPGIGPVTAGSILDWRAENGDFTGVDQLLEVSGIGDATLEKIRDLVTV